MTTTPTTPGTGIPAGRAAGPAPGGSPAGGGASGEAALVRCAAVSRTFGVGSGAVVAVHGVTCAVPPHARVAITGRSGSGKSTLLHLLAGLETPTTGTVTWPALGGHPRGRSCLIGMVFQGPSLLPPLDVTENVALPLVLSGMPDAQARDRAVDALHAVGIDDLAERLPEELSGGQAQRVAIARVLAAQPSLILADEPTGQLDSTTGEHVLTVLLGAADSLGAALVVSSHDPRVAARFGERWRVTDGALTIPAGPSDPAPRRDADGGCDAHRMHAEDGA